MYRRCGTAVQEEAQPLSSPPSLSTNTSIIVIVVMAIILDAEHPPTEQNAIIEEVLAPRRVIDATKTDRGGWRMWNMQQRQRRHKVEGMEARGT